jgi:hypothetical protein
VRYTKVERDKVEVEIPIPGVIHFKAETQYEISSTFMRLQEFYESPYGVRGQFFTLEEYMDTYAAKHKTKNFSYTSDWAGFNVPGHIVDNFFEAFWGDLLDKEIDFYNLLMENYESENGSHNGKYYIIGSYTSSFQNDVLRHEQCHALWYMYPKFKRQSQALIKPLPKALRKALDDHLTGWGYHKSVLEDETNAYLSTSSMVEIDEYLEKLEIKKFPWDKIFALQKNYADFVEEVKIEEEDDD